MKVDKVNIENIYSYNKNPRINEEAILAIKKSIELFGFNQPIIIDENNIILAGHTRLLALKELDYQEVNIIKLTHLSNKEKKAYRIADNKTAEYSSWNKDLLLSEIMSLDNLYTGFTDAEIDKLKIKMDDAEPLPEYNIFELIVDCNTSEIQKELYERFIGEGLKCQLLDI